MAACRSWSTSSSIAKGPRGRAASPRGCTATTSDVGCRRASARGRRAEVRKILFPVLVVGARGLGVLAQTGLSSDRSRRASPRGVRGIVAVPDHERQGSLREVDADLAGLAVIPACGIDEIDAVAGLRP